MKTLAKRIAISCTALALLVNLLIMVVPAGSTAPTYDKIMFDAMTVIDELDDTSKITSIKNEAGLTIANLYLEDKGLFFYDGVNDYYAEENEIVWKITNGGCIALLAYYYKAQVDQTSDWLPTDINTPKFYVSNDQTTWTPVDIVAEKITVDDWANLQYQLGVVHWVNDVPDNCYLKIAFKGDGVTAFSSLRQSKSESAPDEDDDQQGGEGNEGEEGNQKPVYGKANFEAMTVIDELDDESKIVSIKNDANMHFDPLYLTDKALHFADPANYAEENEIVWKLDEGSRVALFGYYYKGQVDQTSDWLPTDINTPKFYVSSDNATWTPVEIAHEEITVDDWANLQYQLGIVHWLEDVPDNSYLKVAFKGDGVTGFSSLRQGEPVFAPVEDDDQQGGEGNEGNEGNEGEEGNEGNEESQFTYGMETFDAMDVLDEFNDDSKIISLKNDLGKRFDPIYKDDVALHFTDPSFYAAENEVVWKIRSGGRVALLVYYYKGQTGMGNPDWMPTAINTLSFYVSMDQETWTPVTVSKSEIVIDDFANLQYQLGFVHWMDEMPEGCYLKVAFKGDGVTAFSSLRQTGGEDIVPYGMETFDSMFVVDDLNNTSKVVDVKNDAGMKIDIVYKEDKALHFSAPANYAEENEIIWQIRSGSRTALLTYYYRSQTHMGDPDWTITELNIPKFYVSDDQETWTPVEIGKTELVVDDWPTLQYQLGYIHWLNRMPEGKYLKVVFKGDNVTCFSSLRQDESSVQLTYGNDSFNEMDVVDDINDGSKIVSIKNKKGLKYDSLFSGVFGRDGVLHFTNANNYANDNEIIWKIRSGGRVALLAYYYEEQIDMSSDDWMPTEENIPVFYVSTDKETWTPVTISKTEISVDDAANLPFQIGYLHWIDNLPEGTFLKMVFKGNGVSSFSSLRQSGGEGELDGGPADGEDNEADDNPVTGVVVSVLPLLTAAGAAVALPLLRRRRK